MCGQTQALECNSVQGKGVGARSIRERLNCWGKASLGLPKLGEAWLPNMVLAGGACEQTQGGGSEGSVLPGRHRGRGNKVGMRQDPCCKRFLLQGYTRICKQDGDCMAEPP